MVEEDGKGVSLPKENLEAILRTLNNSALVAITDIEGNITYVNDKFVEVSKYKEEELIGENHRILKSGHHPDSFYKELWDTISEGKVWRGEIKNMAKDGSFYWVDSSVSPIVDDSGKIKGYLAVRFLITKKKEYEEKMQGMLSSLNNSALVAITDIEGNITYVNDKFVEVSKYKEEELIGENHRILKSGHHPDSFYKELWDTISEGKVWRGEIKNMAKDGSFYWVDSSVSPIVDDSGKIEGYLAVRFLITDKKLLQDKIAKKTKDLIKANKTIRKDAIELKYLNQLKNIFTDIIRHDLLNPLTNMQLNAEILAENNKSKELKSIRNSITVSQNIIAAAREYARIEDITELEKKSADLKKIIQGVEEQVLARYKRAGLVLENKVENSIPLMVNDLIGEVFLNLLTNALKYAASGKKVIIESEETEASYFIRVIDFGEGIPEKYKKAVFTRLTRKEKKGVKGTGLGLAIVKKIVELHGGKVWITDNPQGGAIFWVELPKNVK